MKKLKGKNCLITGAASGIGRQLALQLAKEGMNLFLSDIVMDKLEEVKEEIEKMGNKVFICKCDVSKFDEMQHLADVFFKKYEDLDLLINNVGIAGGGFIEAIELSEWKRVFEVNFWSIVYAIKIFLPKMLERGSGHFVSTGSGAGIVGLPAHPHYVASKFAVVGLTEALYSELYNSGINFSVICPIRVNTNIGMTSPITIDPSLLTETDPEEIKKKFQTFREIWWEDYFSMAIEPEYAAKKYIKGIKKNKLYIFDKRRVRLAMFIKAVGLKHVYKAVLRKLSEEDISAIEKGLVESGLSTRDHLLKELGNRIM